MVALTGPLPAASNGICIANVAVKNIEQWPAGSVVFLRVADETIFNPIRGLKIEFKSCQSC